jgi:hypothetical protein
MSGIDQLAASIAAHSLLQNLQVKPNTKGRRSRSKAMLVGNFMTVTK